MKYAEKFKDPRWQRKRLHVLDRDKWMCVLCLDAKTTLNIHHLSYTKNPWDTPDDQLLTVCEPCHESIHFLLKHYTGPKNSTMIEWLRLGCAAHRDCQRLFKKWSASQFLHSDAMLGAIAIWTYFKNDEIS